jgi:hypothetical protein
MDFIKKYQTQLLYAAVAVTLILTLLYGVELLIAPIALLLRARRITKAVEVISVVGELQAEKEGFKAELDKQEVKEDAVRAAQRKESESWLDR